MCGYSEKLGRWCHVSLKENGGRLIDGEQMTASRVSEGVEGLSKKEKGLMDMDNSVVIAGGRGAQWD